MSLEARLAAAPNALARRKVISDSGTSPSAALVFSLCREAQSRMRVNVKEASGYTAAACDVARRIHDPRAKAEALRMNGHVNYLRGSHREAARSYEKAIDILDGIGELVDAGRTRSSALQTLMYLGRYEQAFEWAQKARQIFEAGGDELRLARLDSNMANILERQQRFDEAVCLYQSALTKLEQLGDEESAAIALRNMAVSYMGLYDFSSALATNERALAYYRRKGLTLLEAEVNDNIAWLHSLRGEYTKAIALYQNASLEERGSSYHFAVSKLDQSDLYLELNLFTEAAQLAQDAADRFRKLGMRYDRAKSLVNLGVALVHSAESAQGLRLFDQARRLFLYEPAPFAAAVTDLYKGAALLESGHCARAREIVESADVILAQSPLVGKAVAAQVLLGRVCLAADDVAEAREAAMKAAERLPRSDTVPLRFQVQALRSAVAEAEGDLPAAMDGALAAACLIESLRGRLQHDELKVAFLADKQQVYGSLVDLSLRLGTDPAETLRYVERAKSWSLADAVTQLADGSAAEPAQRFTDRGSSGSLRQKLSWLYRRLDRAEANAKADETDLMRLREQITQCERELTTALTTSHRVDPNLPPLAGAPDFRPEAVQSLLPESTGILEYFEVRGSLHLFLITAREVRHVEMGPMNDIRRLRRMLSLQMGKGQRSLAANPAVEGAWIDATVSHLRRLYELLIRPAEPWLPAGHWVVIPHGDLHGLAFHALHDGDNFIIDRHTISYAPSASTLHLCSSRSPAQCEQALVMGVPDRHAPFIRQECEAIAQLIPEAQVFVGSNATAKRLVDESARSRFVHLATHGIFRADNPMFSSLRLGDSRFCVFDIRKLRLDAELVTLSGCSTGVHDVVGADEIPGLTRGLLLAGARAVQVSLWEVNDSSTAEYMRLFYQRLTAGADICDAMRASMLALRERHPHPYFWAPFAYVGRLPGRQPIFLASAADPLEMKSRADAF